MKHRILTALRTACTAAVVLVAASFTLSWGNHAHADLFDSLKKTAEKALQKEIEDVLDGQSEQPVQTQPDMALYETQIYLGYLGYDVGLPDGMLNDQTSMAIRKYQVDSGLPITGLVTAGLSASVKVAYATFIQTGKKPVGAGSGQPTPSTTPDYTATQNTHPATNPGGSSAQVPQTSTNNSPSASASSTGGLTPTAAPTSGDFGSTTGSSGGLAPTASYGQATADAGNGASVLHVPDSWSSVVDGIVIPHPVSVDGRLLSPLAIEHYAQWMGLADRRAANAALAEYLELVGLGMEPGMIEKDPMRYVMFLSRSERDRYICPTKPMTDQEVAATSSGKMLPGCTSMAGELVWAGSNEFETRRSRQNFLNDYRDRLVAAAPKLPIDFLDTGEAVVSQYDAAKQGFTISGRQESFGLMKGPQHLTYPGTRNEQLQTSRGVPLQGLTISGAMEVMIDEPINIGEEDPRSSSGLYAFWPMGTTEAEALINRLWAPKITDPRCTSGKHLPGHLMRLCNPERKLYTLFHRTLTEPIVQPGTPTSVQGKMIATSATAYEDAMFERQLYRFDINGKSSAAQSAKKTDKPASPIAVPASVNVDPASGEPIYRAGEPASDKLSALASGGDGFEPINVPLYRGAPVITYTGFSWSHEASGLAQLEPIHMYLQLTFLGDQPASLAYPAIAGQYLTVEARAPYMAEHKDRQHRTTCCGWLGANEIDTVRTKDKFVKEFTPRFVTRAPKAPFDMWLNLEVKIVTQYDFDRQGFSIGLPAQLPDIVERSFEFPDGFVSMSPEAAEKLFAELHGFRVLYLSIRTEITSVVGFSRVTAQPGGYRNPFQIRALNRVKSMNLYADKAMTRLVKKYQ